MASVAAMGAMVGGGILLLIVAFQGSPSAQQSVDSSIRVTGKHCPEGWTLYPFPGPQLANVTETGSAEASYYTWVDQFNTFGLGPNVPLATGNANESLMALVNG